MGVLETRAFEVWHWIGLAPDDVVQDPEALVLQSRADAEDVMVRTDHPDGAGVGKAATSCGQPSLGKGVIGCEISKLVPVVIDASNFRPSGRLFMSSMQSPIKMRFS